KQCAGGQRDEARDTHESLLGGSIAGLCPDSLPHVAAVKPIIGNVIFLVQYIFLCYSYRYWINLFPPVRVP
ncbi:MAG: hypothetical protein J0626_09195, partial [Rhodospirillaceae bacterium]|nr:hypothetical protein [Rhodospirillaceae bacterium]